MSMIEFVAAVNSLKRHVVNSGMLAIQAKRPCETRINVSLIFSTLVLNNSRHTLKPVGSQHVDCDDILSTLALGIYDDEVIFSSEADASSRFYIG